MSLRRVFCVLFASIFLVLSAVAQDRIAARWMIPGGREYTQLRFSSDTNDLLGYYPGRPGLVTVWNATTKKALWEYAKTSVMGAEFSPATLQQMWQAADNPARAGAAEVRTVANHPGIRSDATDDFFAAANAATERLWVMTPYIGDEEVVKTLLEAKRRNPQMDVRVLVPGLDVKQNPLFAKLSQSYYAELIEGGVEVYGYERMMHAKAWLADDTFTIGSTNLSRGSLSHYMELSASVRDAGVAARAVQMLEADFSPERRMTTDDVDGFGLRTVGFVRRLFNLWF